KFIDAFKRMLTMTLALIMVLGSVIPITTQEASAFSGRVGSKYTVHWYKELHYGSGSGGYSNAAKCDLGDDLGSRYSICVQPNKNSPVWSGDQTRTVTVDKVVTDATDTGKWNALRNIVYYSPSYPGFKKNIEGIKQFYYGDEAKDFGVAHLALAYVYAGRPSDMATWGGTHASDLGELWTRAKALANALYDSNAAFDEAVPESFKIFICYMDGVQDMVVGYLEAPGHLNMKKLSNRTSITDGNNCYSLEGAQYTVYDKSGAAAGTLTLNAKGESNTIDLMEGSYTVKETYAPPGYAKDDETYSVKVVSEETTTFTAKDEPITDLVQLLLTKNPVGYPHDHGEGDATLKGAVYKFEYYDRLKNQEVLLKAAKADAPLRTWHFVTDEHGKIDGQNPAFASGYSNDALYKDKDGKVCYPLGTYLIQEVKAPEGYLVNDEILEVEVTEDGTDNIHVKTYNESIKGNDTIKRGGVKVAKIDNDLDEAYAQGDATLAGAEFTIYNQSRETVMVGGKEIAKGGAALVISTNADGIATSDAHTLPYGSYLVKETKPSKGYLLNTEWSRAFTVREDGKIVDLTEDKVREAVIRGGVQIIKRDKELVKSEALGGARLDDIVMTIKNVSGRDVVVRKDFGDPEVKVDWKKLESKSAMFEDESIKRVPTGKDVGKITVHWNEEKKAYTAETLADDLPYGTYTIRESKTNETYQRTDKTEHMFTIREDGVIVAFDDNKNEMALTFDDYVYRSDVQGIKIADSTSERFSFVPFKIISVTNGETHVVVTDKNGFFSTKDRRAAGDLDEDEDADTARKQNPFDDLLEAKDIKTADLEKRSQDILHGVWFGTGEFGDKAPMNSKFGALPYDSYILEEMPCEHNEGYILQKFYFTVDQKSQNGFVDLETITDDVPEIGTTASVDGKNRNIRPQKEIKLVDVIEYKNLKKGETYTAKGVLMDKATKAPVLDMNGKQITAEQEFKTFMSSGKVKVTFTFDATSLYGKDTVVFEKVFDSEGHVAARHEEIDDEGQTVTWEKLDPKYEMYKIRTTKAPSAGDKYGFFAQDEVEYEVHIENTGNIEITMDVTDQFTQNPEYFTVPVLKDVKFTGKGTWNNKGKDDKVANITLNVGEKATVTYTAVVKDEAKAYLAANAKDSDSLDEKNHDTNMAYQKNKTDDKDGYWNTAECVNVTYPNPEKPEEPGKLEPKKDVAQTPVQKPAIGTSLANGKGDKTVAAAKDTQLIDTIAYIGLDTSKWYVFEGTLMVKDSGDPLVEHGKPVTVISEPFKPARPDGTAKVSFIIDTTELDGKELVAFENCYRLNEFKKGDDVSKADKTVVADHKDLNDEGQTVKVSKTAKSVPPKTGDNTMLWLYGVLFTTAMCGMLFLVAKEYARRRRQAKRDAEMFI
ncbi:MAG: VaFE repeat-containing surface-anchored protein, partial [Mogibacterium sp.]|nr:VaFE repeat-containing surface-anchored protein [Mogibacterium sp.]